jgi:hypothetical protein
MNSLTALWESLLHRRGVELSFVIAGIGALSLLLLGNALTYPFNHDEHQYVAAASLIPELGIYRDFLHLGTPYFPLLASVLVAFDPDQPLLMARLFNWLAGSLCLVTTYALCRYAKAPVFIALGAAALFATSSVVHYSFGASRSDILPCLFALVGLYAYLQASSSGSATRGSLLNFVAAVMLAAAVGSRVTYAFAPATIVLFSLWRQTQERRPGYLRQEFLPLAAGGVAGAIPMMWLALSNLQGFWYGVVGYHSSAPLAWYASRGLEDRLQLADQLEFFMRNFLRTDATLAASIWLATIAFVWLALPSRPRLIEARGTHVLLLILLLASVPFGLIPKPTWTQYFVPLVPLLIVAPVFLQRALPVTDANHFRAALAAAVICLGCLPGTGRLVLNVPAAMNSSNWTSTELHAIGNQVGTILQREELSGPVATLGPIYVLESRYPIYPEFANGVFFFRTADLVSRDTAVQVVAASPSTLDELFTDRPPAGVLLGVESDPYVDVEAPLREWAIRNGYRPVELTGDPAATLYLPPS